MRKNVIKIKISASELEALALGYADAVEEMEEESRNEAYSELELLLLEHAREMLVLLQNKIDSYQQKYTLNLKGSEAMAMWRLWQRKFTLNIYSGNAVRKVTSTIDQKAKSAQWIIR